jgi:hypothetical protein
MGAASVGFLALVNYDTGSAMAADPLPARRQGMCRCSDSVIVAGPSPWCDITAHGADARSRNNSPAIQRAIECAKRVGGTVFFPPADRAYACAETLDLSGIAQGIVLLGGPATLAYTAATGSLVTIESSNHVRMHNLGFLYTHPDYGEEGPDHDGDHLIRIGGGPDHPSAYFLIENCQFDGTDAAQGARTFVNIDWSICSAIRRAVFSRAEVGIVGRTHGFSNSIQVEDCVFISGGLSVAAIKNAGESWLISGCTFEPLRSGKAGGFVHDNAVGGVWGLTFISNWFGDVAVQDGDGGTYIDLGSGHAGPVDILGLAVINNRFAEYAMLPPPPPPAPQPPPPEGAALRLRLGQGGAIIGNRFETPTAIRFGPDVPTSASIEYWRGLFIGGNDFSDAAPAVTGLEWTRSIALLGNNAPNGPAAQEDGPVIQLQR